MVQVPRLVISSKAMTVILVTAMVGGCLGGGGGTGTTSLSSQNTTDEQIHATGKIMGILNESERVEDILVNDTYTYETGKYEKERGVAVAYIRTGSLAGERGGTYRIQINTTEENVTAIKKVDSINLTTSE